MRYLIICLILSMHVTTYAEEVVIDPPVQAIPPGDDEIVPVRRGEQAPFTGQLFSQSTALRWGNWLSQYRARLAQDIGKEKRLCSAELSYASELRLIEEERNRKIEDDLKVRLTRSEERNNELQNSINNPSFWSSLEFGVILGVVGSSAVAVAVGMAALN